MDKKTCTFVIYDQTIKGLSRTPAPHLPHTGYVSKVSEVPSELFLSAYEVVSKVKSNLVILPF